MASPKPSPGPAAAISGTPGLAPAEHWTALGMPTAEENSDADSALGSDTQSSTASVSESILAYRTIHGRTYHSDRKAGDNLYWGANDEKASELLDIMSHALTLAIDGKLHLAPLPENFSGRALDIGTGTGVWAIDFADQYANSKVTGTDLSPIQPQWIPPNCEFLIDDATQAWTWAADTFDYIHMRWLVGSITDWSALFREIYRCLKPGGWVEWYELDGGFKSDDNSVPEKSTLGQWKPIYETSTRMAGSKASFSNVADRTQQRVMKEVGLINYADIELRLPCSEWPADKKHKEIGMYVRAGLDQDAEGVLHMPASIIGWSEEQVLVFAAHLRKDLREKKMHAYCEGRVAWSQKPLAS